MNEVRDPQTVMNDEIQLLRDKVTVWRAHIKKANEAIANYLGAIDILKDVAKKQAEPEEDKSIEPRFPKARIASNIENMDVLNALSLEIFTSKNELMQKLFPGIERSTNKEKYDSLGNGLNSRLKKLIDAKNIEVDTTTFPHSYKLLLIHPPSIESL